MSTTDITLFRNALRVASAPVDEYIANRPITDQQRRAIFASQGGRNASGGTGISAGPARPVPSKPGTPPRNQPYFPSRPPANGTTITDPLTGKTFVVGMPIGQALHITDAYQRALNAWQSSGAGRDKASPNTGYPAHWGEPPKTLTKDIRELPGGYGKGSSTLAKWIAERMAADRAPVKPMPVTRPGMNKPLPPRKWGETRPGEMYPQVEGPGNPSWERRNPQSNSNAPSKLPPWMSDITNPRQPPRMTVYQGGNNRVVTKPTPARQTGGFKPSTGVHPDHPAHKKQLYQTGGIKAPVLPPGYVRT